MITKEIINQAKYNLNIKSNPSCTFYKELTRNTIEMTFKSESEYRPQIFYVTLTDFIDTCGIHIISKISTTLTDNSKNLKTAFKLLEEISRLSRKSAQIYLIADQPQIREILVNHGWTRLKGSFINRNSENKNTIYIKRLYK